MPRREMPVAILDEMEKFDEQIASPVAVGEQATDLIEGSGIDLTPLWDRSR